MAKQQGKMHRAAIMTSFISNSTASAQEISL